MLVAWKYRKRENSLIQKFDPRAWLIFFACFFLATLSFWDVRFLLPFWIIAVFVLLTFHHSLYFFLCHSHFFDG
jgi:energy-coupling factor transport system permease protein